MITHEITLDMQVPGASVILHANQSEVGAREIQVTLTDKGTLWQAPVGTAYVSYRRKNGTGGIYDVLEDGETPAVVLSADRTVATVQLAENVLAFSGVVELDLLFVTGHSCTYTFSWMIAVHPALGGSTAAAENYFTVFQGELDALREEIVGIELPTVTAADNGKVLRVVNGVWAAASLPSAAGGTW